MFNFLSLEFLSGYRTKLAGIAGLLTGLAMLATVIANGDWNQLPTAIGAIGAGLAALGLAGKAEKLTDAVGNGK